MKFQPKKKKKKPQKPKKGEKEKKTKPGTLKLSEYRRHLLSLDLKVKKTVFAK